MLMSQFHCVRLHSNCSNSKQYLFNAAPCLLIVTNKSDLVQPVVGFYTEKRMLGVKLCHEKKK